MKNDIQIFRRKYIHFNFPGVLLSSTFTIKLNFYSWIFNYEQTNKNADK